MKHATKNTHGCCDGHGQVHHVAGDDPNYTGPLSYIVPCHDAACLSRRAAAWDRECEMAGAVSGFVTKQRPHTPEEGTS